MSADLVVPIIASLAWLVIATSAFASHRLGWSATIRMVLVWVAIFAGLFLVVEWFMAAGEPVSDLV